MGAIRPNNKKLRATFYRGVGNEEHIVYGPVPCNVAAVTSYVQPEKTNDSGANTPTGVETVSHRIFIDLPKRPRDAAGNPTGDAFRPLLDDRIVITDSVEGAHDGSYVIKRYPSLHTGRNKRFNFVEMECRFLGIKKPGDEDNNNNTGNIRMGMRLGRANFGTENG